MSLLLGALLMLAACEEFDFAPAPSSEFISPLPEGVLNIAAPNQNLNAVKIDPIDGCYVFQHVGPVETTYLPLRSVNGNPICSRPAEEPAPAPAT